VLEHEQAELAAQRAIEPAPIAQIALPNPYALPSRREKPHFVEGTSESRIILSDEILTEINGELFDRHRDMAWRMLYDFMDHGVSLSELYSMVQDHAETLLIVKTRDGEVFGAFATESWVPYRPREYYGTGESFVFAVRRSGLEVFKWAGVNDLVMSSSSEHLAMGAGGAALPSASTPSSITARATQRHLWHDDIILSKV
jgi:hypothetical protein